MKVPVPLKIGALTVATTAFYTLVGQLVPQKEVQPPKETELKKEMTADELVKAGRGHHGGQGALLHLPHLRQVGGAALPRPRRDRRARRPRVARAARDVDYLAQSIYEPSAFIVPGLQPRMPVINKPPIGLTDQEILAVIAYLQSLGGKVTVTLELEGLAARGGARPRARAAPASPRAEAMPALQALSLPALAGRARRRRGLRAAALRARQDASPGRSPAGVASTPSSASAS